MASSQLSGDGEIYVEVRREREREREGERGEARPGQCARPCGCFRPLPDSCVCDSWLPLRFDSLYLEAVTSESLKRSEQIREDKW